MRIALVHLPGASHLGHPNSNHRYINSDPNVSDCKDSVGPLRGFGEWKLLVFVQRVIDRAGGKYQAWGRQTCQAFSQARGHRGPHTGPECRKSKDSSKPSLKDKLAAQPLVWRYFYIAPRPIIQR